MQDNAVRLSGSHAGANRTPRVFSPQTEKALAQALAEYDPESPHSDEAVRTVVMNAAAEARGQLWRPEELVSVLRAAVPEKETRPGAREALLALLKRRALLAFFGAQESAF